MRAVTCFVGMGMAVLCLVGTWIPSSRPTATRAADPADAIYHGGDVVTIDDKNPTAEAVAVKGGKIVAAGKKDEVLKLKGEKTKLIDLKGRCLLPGFVDGHGHCLYVGVQAASANLLPPPDHTVKNIAALQAELKKWAAGDTAKRFEIILGFGYDDAQLKEQRHPTRHELDEVSKDLPVLIIHQSSHLAAMNTKALELAGITADTKNPPGGVIRREKDGKTPDGVLEETAFMVAAVKLLPKIGDAELDALGLAGQRLYAANGYTFAQEGRSNAMLDKTWMRLAKGKKMLIDVASYPDLTFSDTPFGLDTPWYGKAMKNGYRIAGVKLSFDGSPQGKTAFLSQPYFIPPHGQPSSFAGYPTVPAKEVNRKIALCYQKGWQFLAHCNGDAASDMMLGGVKDARAKHGPGKDRRDVMIHCQTVREDQLDTMKEYGVIPSMFGMHCFYWGDWHRDSVLGAERAERISPARSALKRGMIFSQHHDAPVALPNAIRILSSVVTRRTRSGDVLGAGQCVPVGAALKSITLWAAYQHYEEANRGSIEAGKLADFVVLDRNPMKVPISALADLKVVETIKEGKSIYQAKTGKSRGVSHIIKADGFQLEAFVFGDGPVSLIMAAGNGRPAAQLDDLAQAISANGIKVVTYNYRTLGASTGKIDNLTLHDYADDVWRVADGLGLKTVFLAGKTYGNRVVRTAAQDRPERVLGVILIGAGGEVLPDKKTMEKYKRYLDPKISKEEWLKLQGELTYAPGNEKLAELDQAQGEFPELAAAQAKASDATPKEQWRLGGTAPMLILTGLQDVVAVPESALTLAKARPKAWLVALPNCGHNMLNERGDDVKRLMVDFILHTPSDAVKPAAR